MFRPWFSLFVLALFTGFTLSAQVDSLAGFNTDSIEQALQSRQIGAVEISNYLAL